MGRTATTRVIIARGSDPVLLGSHAHEALRLSVDPWNKRLADSTPFL